MKQVQIYDTTLRDGAQQEGISFSVEDKLKIARKLDELWPQGPNGLGQMDVTYVHIPGYGWGYAITVIDDDSRSLLACPWTNTYWAWEATQVLDRARREAERIGGPLETMPFLVTDHGPTFMAQRFYPHIQDRYSHVRIPSRTPTPLDLLERFHRTLKAEEIDGRLYENPTHGRQCL